MLFLLSNKQVTTNGLGDIASTNPVSNFLIAAYIFFAGGDDPLHTFHFCRRRHFRDDYWSCFGLSTFILVRRLFCYLDLLSRRFLFFLSTLYFSLLIIIFLQSIFLLFHSIKYLFPTKPPLKNWMMPPFFESTSRAGSLFLLFLNIPIYLAARQISTRLQERIYLYQVPA